MDEQHVERQILSTWTDISAYGLPLPERQRWHRYLNDHLSDLCVRHPQRFAMLAIVPLPDGTAAAAELDRAVHQLGAVGAVIGANIEGVNLGELDLDEFWQASVELDVGVFIHPVQAMPVPRTSKFALGQIAQYTHDTTLSVGSLIFSGVLDRFPKLRLLLSHGGGTFPYLTGRFDIMHARMDRNRQGDVAQSNPSDYVTRFYYDSIVHDPAILRWLTERVTVDRVVLGSDYSFPPEDRDPIGTVRKAGLANGAFEKIVEDNPRILFPRL
jgi:aminocarboxymuconate-semialdehyde decarboxylase